jgi:hypothetical protein
MTDQELISRIMERVIGYNDYERMVALDCDGIDTMLSYNDFLSWNEKCLRHLNAEEISWTIDLCKRLISRKEVGMMDLESCAVFKAAYIYFDKKGKICIVNPR